MAKKNFTTESVQHEVHQHIDFDDAWWKLANIYTPYNERKNQ